MKFEEIVSDYEGVDCWSARELQCLLGYAQWRNFENNTAVRGVLLERGIVPENLPPAEDVNKVERKLKSDVKKKLK